MSTAAEQTASAMVCNCGRRYSCAEFLALPLPHNGRDTMDTGANRIRLRNCWCNSTIGMPDPESETDEVTLLPLAQKLADAVHGHGATIVMDHGCAIVVGRGGYGSLEALCRALLDVIRARHTRDAALIDEAGRVLLGVPGSGE
jgi:hypothetical protein